CSAACQLLPIPVKYTCRAPRIASAAASSAPRPARFAPAKSRMARCNSSGCRNMSFKKCVIVSLTPRQWRARPLGRTLGPLAIISRATTKRGVNQFEPRLPLLFRKAVQRIQHQVRNITAQDRRCQQGEYNGPFVGVLVAAMATCLRMRHVLGLDEGVEFGGGN